MLKFLFTRKPRQENEDVLHGGEKGTLPAFEAKAAAEKHPKEAEAALPRISFEP